MQRRQFLGWMGVAASAIGMASLLSWSHEDNSSSIDWPENAKLSDPRVRMNGRACHDYRMISEDRSLFIDRKMLDV